MTIRHLLSGDTFVIKFQREQAPGHSSATEEVVKRNGRGDYMMAYQLLLGFDYLALCLFAGLCLEFSKVTLCKYLTVCTTNQLLPSAVKMAGRVIVKA